MLYINILLIVNMKTFYMHHYLCIVQCVDEKKKTRCTLLNIMQNKETTKTIKKKYKYNYFFVSSCVGACRILDLLLQNFELSCAEECVSIIRPPQSTGL